MTIKFRPPLTKPIYPFERRSDGPNPGRVAGDPATFEVTSPFGNRDGLFHGGLDLGNGHEGDVVVAAAAGKVIASGWLSTPWSDGYGGNMVVIQHASRTATIYAHLQSVAVLAGASVVAGQRVGIVGHSSRVKLPAHLHFGIQAPATFVPNGIATHPTDNGFGLDVDPWPFITGYASLEDDVLVSKTQPLQESIRVVTGAGNAIRTDTTTSDATLDSRTTEGAQFTIIGFAAGEVYDGSDRWYVFLKRGVGLRAIHSKLCQVIPATGITEEQAAAREVTAARNAALAVASAAVDAAKRFGG